MCNIKNLIQKTYTFHNLVQQKYIHLVNLKGSRVFKRKIKQKMFHESQVTFYLCQPLVFLRKQDAYKIQKGKSYKLNIIIERDKLIFMESYQNPLCRLYLSPYIVKRVNEHQIKIFYVEHITDKNNEKHKNEILIADIETSKICIDEILQICPEKKVKSCLSFIPSSVQHISILSGQSPEQKYRGFLNLAGIMFLILNLRNIIDNFLYYGFRFKTAPRQFIPPVIIIAFLGLIIFIELAYHLERLRFSRVISSKTAVKLMVLNQSLLLVYNIQFCQQLQGHPIEGCFFTVMCVVFLLKLISYMQVNSELLNILQRLNKMKQTEFNEFMFANHEISNYNLALIKKYKTEWQELISHGRLWYFIFAPTLCYQLEYPRTSSIRKSWLLKRFVEFAFVVSFQLVLWIQYIEPQLEAWFKLMQTDDWGFIDVVYRWLRLSIPNTIMWITGFYNLFHVFLNIIAQLLRFADRKFYMDWWNCRSLEEYWKTWNLPVHFWFIRHMYNPLLKRGYSKTLSMVLVFLISALAHEFLVCVPLHLISYYAFLAMLLQAPTIYLEKKIQKLLRLKNSELGNASFWLFFCIMGQPICVFIYYSLYMSKQLQNQQVPVSL